MSPQSWSHWATCVTVAPLACVASAAAVRAVAARTRPGLQRLLLCLPALLLYSYFPFLFDVQTISRASAAAMLLWLANFKLLALCLGRGPLTQRDLTLGQFTALLLWPIIPKTGKERRQGNVVFHPRSVFLLALFTLTHPLVPLFVKTYSAAFGVCCYCDLWANACAALVTWAHGLVVAPSWERPWLQTSLADFWGRRWNLPTSSSLKYLVYEPLAEGRLVAASELRTPLTATAAEAPAESNGSGGAKLALDSYGEQPPLPPPPPADGAGGAATLAPAGPAIDDGGNSSSRGPGGAKDIRTDGGKDSKNRDGVVAEAKELTHGSEAVAAAAAATADGAAHSRRSRSGRGGSASSWIRLVGLAATFAVSGVMHELMLCICTGDTSQLGKQALFFAIQAPLMAAEQRLVKALTRARIHPPTWLCIPVASLTLQLPAKYWFWGAYFAAVQPRASPLAPLPAVAFNATVMDLTTASVTVTGMPKLEL
ncbi:hypothetical protein VOLCADRAFT_89895 [Volvox carteri f. nagariensis]|uniref:Wax synthase domain-containing protein n=1 Tax=Volvox carteri f. nagariensis TaxID=3068 RepID=D8TSY2_VOLCA|nr:uncharacterized protein VOLCADRAFT_89895 [Volvox carteri f. nagariensis]EFJ49459.1 hypothetical protein VOLCADRAFT_89895 [Volvox carteri f. nagariensis]|eukprot:XP_002949440.1 hypothetical protein VOLCADRAFT_89895 [Volvox carteri f. nagariensis]